MGSNRSPSNSTRPVGIPRFPVLYAFHGVAKTVEAAHQARLLHALLDGPQTPAEYAARLALDPQATQMVLDVLAEWGFAVRRRGRYTAAPVLVDAEARSGIDFVFAFWDRAPAFLKRGERPGRMDASAEERQASYANVVINLGRAYSDSARDLAARLDGALRRVLDVGAGSGVWSLAMAERHQGTRITGLDFPNVLDAFSSLAKQKGLSDQIDTLAGDAHQIQIPEEQFDRVVVANLLHLETPQRAAALIRRLSLALVPGGDLVVVDSAPGRAARSRRAYAIYVFNRALRTEGGNPHPVTRIKRWLVDAGLTPAREIQLNAPTPHLRAIVGHKPSAVNGSTLDPAR